MTYKNSEITVIKNWDMNVGPQLSRYILFSVQLDDKKFKVVFNRNFMIDMAENAGAQRLNEDKLKIEAIEEIQHLIDEDALKGQTTFYFEYYPNNFVPMPVPSWCQELLTNL